MENTHIKLNNVKFNIEDINSCIDDALTNANEMKHLVKREFKSIISCIDTIEGHLENLRESVENITSE